MVREPLADLKRKRLEKLFEIATKKAATASTPNDFDYLTDLLSQCVAGDLGNAAYVRVYLENLQKRFGNPKKISPLVQFKERGARSAVKKNLAQEQWDEVVLHGLKVLAVNPWDLPTLTAMATAAGKAGDRDCELCYLMGALAGTPKDVACNRLFAVAMADRGQIDKAIVYWHRVEEILPGDEEAKRMIATLTVQKARSTGKFDDDGDVARRAKVKTQQQEELNLEQKLRRKIQEEPANFAHYLELSQAYLNDDRFAEADDLLAKAFELSDGDIDVREKWEDCQVRRLRQQIAKATDPAEKQNLVRQYNEKEVEVYQNRVERYPNRLEYRYELGFRYMKVKRFDDAIRELQAAKNDPRRKGACMLALGQCFQNIKQYPLAMSHYELAVQEIPDRDAENKKRALYLAGRLALALKDLEKAEKQLTILASLDFTYKDVSALLDKIATLRENPEDEAGKPDQPTDQ